MYEEWHTPNSQGDTGDFDYYTFMTYQDAAVFITNLTKDFKADQKQPERDQKEQEKAEKFKQEEAHSKHVYVFALSNYTVKIGVSNAVGRRKQEIQNSSGLEIPRWCYKKK